MPIYEYQCNKCKKCFEKIVSINTKNNTIKCPYCHGPGIKIMSLSNFRLKGNGWAKDGYSKEKK